MRIDHEVARVMDDPSSIAELHGILSIVLGALMAAGVWYVGVRPRSKSKWISGLRFSLWPAVLGALYVGGGVSRALLGIPESRFGTSLSERLTGTIGLWLIGFIVFFPVGVSRAEKHSQTSTPRRPNDEL